MSNPTGPYPSLTLDTTGTGIVSHAGATLLLDTITTTGLHQTLSTALSRWRRPTAIHDPAKILCDLAVTLALGGDCLADLATLRAEPALFGLVASDPTVSRLVDTLARDADRVLTTVNSARAQVRATAWALAGDDAPDHDATTDNPVIIDLDATLLDAHSDKQHAAPTFKRGYGFHPLCAFLDHGSEGTGEPLAMLLRPGNAGSNTAADHITVTRDALRQLPFTAKGGRIGRKVLIRTDAAGGTHEFVNWLHARKLAYSLGFTLPEDAVERLARIPATAWTPAYDADRAPRDGAWSPRPPGYWSCPGGHPGCGSSSARNDRIPVRNSGSPTPTGCG